MLDGPEQAGGGLDRRALRVAVAIGPDFRPRARLAREWIAGRGRAVFGDADGFAQMRRQVLRAVPHNVALAERDEQIAVRRKDDAPAKMRVGLDGGLLAENNL